MTLAVVCAGETHHPLFAIVTVVFYLNTRWPEVQSRFGRVK